MPMPSKTRHPCAGMTKAQRAAFELIAINEHPRATRSTFDALIKKGLIEERREVVGRDALGSVVATRYHVPLPIHMQWCEWCAEQDE